MHGSCVFSPQFKKYLKITKFSGSQTNAATRGINLRQETRLIASQTVKSTFMKYGLEEI